MGMGIVSKPNIDLREGGYRCGSGSGHNHSPNKSYPFTQQVVSIRKEKRPIVVV